MLGRIGVMTGAAAVVLLLAGCFATPEPDSPTTHLPLGIAVRVVASCEQTVGLGGSTPATQVWRDSTGVHVHVGRRSQTSGESSTTAATEAALLACLNVVGGTLPPYPHDSGGLLLQWKYSTTVLWPCFKQHGIDPGPVPSREVFLRGDPLEMNPLANPHTLVPDALWLQVQRDCPLVPPYLRTATPTPTASAPDATTFGG